MKAKNFFTHAGLAVGYFLFFLLIQVWASLLFTTGAGFGLGLTTGASDPFSLQNQLTQRVLELTDVLTLLTYVVCAAFYGCMLYAEQPENPLRAANIRKPRCGAMMWTPVLLGAGIFFAVQGGMMLIPEDAPIMQEYIEASSVLEYGKYPLLTAITTVIGAPLIEELVFRGLMYKHLKKAMPTWIALLLQALIFAAAHGQLLWMAFTFPLAIVLGLLYDYFDSLWPCVLTHLCFNACNYLPFLPDLMLDSVGWLIVMLASLLLCALTWLLMVVYRRMRSAKYRTKELDHAKGLII